VDHERGKGKSDQKGLMEDARKKSGIWNKVREEFSVHHNFLGFPLRFLLFVAAHDSSPSLSIPIRQFPDLFRRFTCSTLLIDTLDLV
jgi:hypothetical protein